MGITGRGQHLEHARVDGQQGHIEGAAAQVEDQNVLLALRLVQPVGNGRSRGLVDDAQHLQPGNDAGVLSGLALGIVEVCGHSHDGVGHLVAEIGLSSLLHLDEHHGRNLLRGKDLLTHIRLDHDVGLAVLIAELEGQVLAVVLHGLLGPLATNKALSVKNGVFRVGGQLVLGGITHQPLTVLGKGNIRRCNTITLVVGDDLHTAILENTHTGVRSAQINADNRAVVGLLFFLLLGRQRRGCQHKGRGRNRK
eukprot:comp19561_c0_seq1/m.22956 comp19561_c0_seq1/g.22956  ORF comp19561_c0_seq1/g.22956 comp19561_c0_seq1/m.22956 type:complete len:252 (+) comp19561_c0_seq1:1358-2113(+)